MTRPTRRALVCAGAAVAATGLGGCLGRRGGDRGRAAPIRLETVEAPGSPGTETRVLPEDGVALLDFFATWCPSCETQMSEFRTVRERFPDLHMLSISWEDGPRAVRAFWTRHGGTWPVATDPTMATAERFGVTSLPTMAVVDADGHEVWRDGGLAAAERIATAVRDARA